MAVKDNEIVETGRLALVGGTLIDGNGKDPLRDAVLIVDGPVIREVGRKRDIKISSDYEVVDVAGKTIMPGMFDCHCHPQMTSMGIEERLFTPEIVQIFRAAEVMKRTLHAGFTTIRTPGDTNVGFRQAVEMGLVEGPRLILAGGMGQTGGHFDMYYPRDVEVPLLEAVICDGVPAVQRAARRLLRQGYDFIKICTTGGVSSPADAPEYTEWTLEELRAIVYEAAAREKAVMAHAEGTQGIKNAIRAGVWSVEHGDVLDDEAIQMFVDTGTYLVPTLMVTVEELERGEEMGLTPKSMAKARRIGQAALDGFEAAAAAGVRMATGTDAYSEEMHGRNARELELMVQHGFTPMQAVVAATKTAAEVCRVDDTVGTLEVGKLADVLVVDGDPLDNISILLDQTRLLVVMKGGTRYVNRL